MFSNLKHIHSKRVNIYMDTSGLKFVTVSVNGDK